jgi:hypothetical protein
MAVFRAIAIVLSGLALYRTQMIASPIAWKGFPPCVPNSGVSGILQASSQSYDEMRL